MSDMPKNKSSLGGLRILRRLAGAGLRLFSLEQAREEAKVVGVRPEYVVEALHLLRQGGWIEGVKRGWYAFTPESGFASPPHDYEIAQVLVQPSAISHWTAMQYHHLTQQMPRTVFASTPSGTSIPRGIDRSRYHFIHVPSEHFFGIEKVWVGEAHVDMTDPERTLLDGLTAPQYCGGFGEVIEGFQMRGDRLDLEKIVEYSLKLPTVVSKRLGWMLETLKVDDDLLRPLADLAAKGFQKLDPSGSASGRYNRKWMLRENLWN